MYFFVSKPFLWVSCLWESSMFLYSCSFLILFLFSLPCYQCATIYLPVFSWGWIFWKVFNLWLLCWSEYLDMSVLLCKHVLFYLLYIWRVNWDIRPNLIMSTSLPKWFYQFIYTPTRCLWELLFFHIFTLSVILILGFRMGKYWFYFIAVSISISLITNEGGQLFNMFIDHLGILFWEMPLFILCPFLHWSVVFVYRICWSAWGDMISLQYWVFWYFTVFIVLLFQYFIYYLKCWLFAILSG